MVRYFLASCTLIVAASAFAGAGSVVVKGASKAVKVATEKYGDDAARVAVRAGTEAAEATLKSSGRMASLAVKSSTAARTALLERGVAAVEKSACQEPERVIKALYELPEEDLPRIIGAMEKNPHVAAELASGVERGGKGFVDRIFAVNGRQILAGTLGAASITAAMRATSPFVEHGETISHGISIAIIAFAILAGLALVISAHKRSHKKRSTL